MDADRDDRGLTFGVGRSLPDGNGKLGAVGFCFGGGIVNQFAVRMGPNFAAGVPFYGTQPSAADSAKIRTPINAQYGELDSRITDGWPAFDAALSQAGIRMRVTSIRAPITVSITIRPRAMTKPLPRKPGNVRWTGSTNTCGPDAQIAGAAPRTTRLEGVSELGRARYPLRNR